VRRADELAAAAAILRQRRAGVLKERRFVLELFEDEKEAQERYGFLGPIRGWVMSPHEWHYRRMAELQREEAAFRLREKHFDELVKRIYSLRGIQVVSSPFIWNEGLPLGGRSPLGLFFDATLPGVAEPHCPPGAPACRPIRGKPPAAPLWLTSAGNVRGQVWTGPYRDLDRNHLMEFVAADTQLPAGLWTGELAFLAWQPWNGPRALDLPAKNRFRVTVQWTETHDPDYFLRPGEPDLYLQPLNRLRLTVLRQRDPAGKVLPADDFVVVARSGDRSQRLDNFPHSSTYELSLEFTADQAGRYALQLQTPAETQWVLVPAPRGDKFFLRRLTGQSPQGIRPLGTATLPALEKHSPLSPRFFVQAVAGPSQGLGRPVFRDYATDLGTVGVPADARRLIAVGAADLEKRPEAFSAPGPPPNLELFVAPRLLAFDGLDLGLAGKGPARGASLATPFAAGAAAALLSAGWTRDQINRYLLGSGQHVLEVRPRP
jgi:hypothetical protein